MEKCIARKIAVVALAVRLYSFLNKFDPVGSTTILNRGLTNDPEWLREQALRRHSNRPVELSQTTRLEMVLTPARLAGEDQTRVPQHTLSISSLDPPCEMAAGFPDTPG